MCDAWFCLPVFYATRMNCGRKIFLRKHQVSLGIFHIISYQGPQFHYIRNIKKFLSFFSKAIRRIFLKYWNIAYWLETVQWVLLMWCLESKVPCVWTSFDWLDLANFQILQLTLYDTEVWAYFLESSLTCTWKIVPSS